MPDETKVSGTKRQSASKPERRASVRHPCRLEATCYLLPGSETEACTGRIVDLSTGGISLLLARSFPVGKSVGLKLHGADTCHTLTLKVLHVEQLSKGCWLLGGGFTTGLSQADLHALLS
jgi:hypothetical protein